MSDIALRRAYERIYSGVFERSDTADSSDLGRTERRGLILARIISSKQQTMTVVDLGCRDGECIQVAIDACNATPQASAGFVGLDWSAIALKKAREGGLPVVRASVNNGELPLASSSVDVVIMGELIEHLVDPDNALDEAWRILVPGGTLLLSTPNLAAWYNRALLAVGIQPLFTEVSLREIHGRPGTDVVGHLRIFTRRALFGLLNAIGFSEICIEGAPYHDVPGPLRPLDRLFCRTPSLASILIAVARKPGPSQARNRSSWENGH